MMIRTPSFVSNKTIFKTGKAVRPSSMQSNNLYLPFGITSISFLYVQNAPGLFWYKTGNLILFLHFLSFIFTE